ncbi:MAG TPA: penicillin-binding transpeptidase domain-containing protein [Baekduia sp.]|nr:penicillin-binding transpeptidase domain-containing protein [Baekduia sp.]
MAVGAGPRSTLTPARHARRPPLRHRRGRLTRRALPLLVAGAALAGGAVVVLGGSDAERTLVREYVAAWNRQDYAAMWERTTDAVRERTDAAGFARTHRRALDTATAQSLRAGAPRERRDGAWEVPVRVRTRIFGLLRGRVVLPVEGEGDEAAVAWRGHLTFPGLQPGDRLRRTTTMPERATLTARDGRPLAAGPERTSSLPGASAIVGAVGSVPPERSQALRRQGVPADAQVGLTGLERILDDQLRGTPGGELRAGRRLIAEVPARRAQRVRSTIAPSVQEAAVTALGDRLGGVVALRPRTGEILGVAGIGFSGLQPPGSTFKVVSAAAALQAGKVKASDRFPVATSATLSGVELENANGESCGGTFIDAFAHSCNSVFGPLGARTGAQRLVRTAEAFGFNRAPEIPGAATSTIPQPDDIGDDLAVGSTAIGQGRVQASPLQMALVTATVALGGRRPVPTLDGRRIGERAQTTEVIGPRAARTLRRAMVAVVAGGTGKSAALGGVQVAGKTGTAELKTTQGCAPPEEVPPGGPAPCAPDDQTDTTAWFVAFAPAREPEVAVAVMLVGAGTGGDSAAPVARQVLQTALR